jgi:hypothetical protein
MAMAYLDGYRLNLDFLEHLFRLSYDSTRSGPHGASGERGIMLGRRTCLGIALALTAIGTIASTALASQGHLTAEELSYPAILNGTDLTEKPTALTVPAELGESVECADSSYDGEIKEATESLALLPTFNNANCHSGTHKATVTTNGCSYLLHIGEGGGDSWAGTADLVCPAGKVVEGDIYFASSNENLLVCKFKLKEQKGLKGLTVTNDTEGEDLVLEGPLTGVGVEEEGAGCGTHSTNEAKLDLNATVKGTSPGGDPQRLVVD